MSTFFDGTRRHFLRLGLTAIACAGTTTPAFAFLARPLGTRAIAFHNLHTDERLRTTYWRDGKYDMAGMAQIDHILRDHYSGDVFSMNPRLIDLLFDLQGRLGNEGPIEIISGYRSPKTNSMLARMSDGVARNSFHTKGMAIDIRMQNTPLPQIHNVALMMRRGGVGYYPDSQFVHVDVGPVRRW
jgi:uncharacterized protein YcbK (DUF882 family)